jgi:anti-anti-sigma regulatory factor/anti-sigma regulatory factor (Ser/Thr protein kinase)
MPHASPAVHHGPGNGAAMCLSATMDADPLTEVITVTLDGLLTAASVPAVRNLLLTCLAGSPDTVIVDLTKLRVDNRCQLAVFPTAARASGAPGGTLLLYGACAAVAAMMTNGVLDDVPVYATRELALAAVAATHPPAGHRVQLRLAPVVSAAGFARHVIDAACRSWRLGHLSAPATLVISELVSNAVKHAGTNLCVDAAYQGGFLRLSVRDGSRCPPVSPQSKLRAVAPLSESGRGLFLVDVYATAWGSDPVGDGKSVWATLRATPATDAPGGRVGSASGQSLVR